MPNSTAWKASTQPDRPLLISAVCLLLFFTLVATVLELVQTLPATAERQGDWIWIYSASEVFVSLVCVAGLWFMQRWSLFLMGAFLAARVAVALVNSLPLTGLPFVVGVGTILVGLLYLQQMQ